VRLHHDQRQQFAPQSVSCQIVCRCSVTQVHLADYPTSRTFCCFWPSHQTAQPSNQRSRINDACCGQPACWTAKDATFFREYICLPAPAPGSPRRRVMTCTAACVRRATTRAHSVEDLKGECGARSAVRVGTNSRSGVIASRAIPQRCFQNCQARGELVVGGKEFARRLRTHQHRHLANIADRRKLRKAGSVGARQHDGAAQRRPRKEGSQIIGVPGTACVRLKATALASAAGTCSTSTTSNRPSASTVQSPTISSAASAPTPCSSSREYFGDERATHGRLSAPDCAARANAKRR